MNTYEMEGFLRGQCVPRDLLVNESNAAYLVRKLSEITSVKAERDALAVENAGFKHALSVILEHVDVTEKGQAGVVAMIANDELFNSETPATSAALAAIQEQVKAEAIEQLAIQLDQLPDEALEFLSDAAEFETYQEEHHTFVSISNPRAVANAVLSLVKEQSTDPREAK